MANKTELVKIDEEALAENWWDDAKQRCLELILIGIPKLQIARELGVHRNTVNNWCAHPIFHAETQKLYREHVASTRVRRLMETNRFNTRIAKLASRYLTMVEDGVDPTKPDKKLDNADIRTAREWLSEYRNMREEERKDIGDNVKRVESRSHVVLDGEIRHEHTTHDSSFREWMNANLEDGVIDVDDVDAPENANVLSAAVQQTLMDSDILDVIDEEDRVAEDDEQ